VLSPKDGATVTSRVIEFRGVTERGAEVFSGPYEAETDADGDWAINLVLAPGDNGAAFTARDAAGNETTIRIVVTYDAPDATTTTTKAPSTATTTQVTTTTKATTTTTQPAATSSGYSPLWPADPKSSNVEAWRSDVQAHWAADRVDCVLGIIKLESGGNPTASNGGRYLGLMQHSATYWPSRAKGAGFVDGDGLVASPFNGEANIAAGAYLADYYDRIGKDWRSPWTVWTSISACQS
jgi:soluble lytic murein transglycosylase-like protein